MSRAVLALLGGLTLVAGCGGGGEGGPTTPPDLTAPLVEARPPGGAYPAVAYVTLVADEIARVEYTLDGSEPATGAPATRTGANPVFWLRMGEGITTLRYRAVDPAGNASAVRTDIYTVDAVPPHLTLRSPPPGPLALLGEVAVTWRADEPVAWVAEWAADAAPGPWLPVASGVAAASVDVTLRLGSRDLWPGPAMLRITATDGAGHPAALSVPLEVLGPEVVHTHSGPAGQGGLATSPSGDRAFVLSAQAVVAIDLGPSTAYGTEAWSRPVASYQPGLSLEADGGRLWIADWTGDPPWPTAIALNPATGAPLDSVPLPAAALAVSHLAATSGSRLLVQTLPDGLLELDVDPASPAHGGVVGVSRSPWSQGLLLPSPDRRRLLTLAYPAGQGQAGLLVTDPSDPANGTILGTLDAQLDDWQLAGAWRPDGLAVAIGQCAGSTSCSLARYELASDALVSLGAWTEARALAWTPEGAELLVATQEALLALDPSTLEIRGRVPLAAALSSSVSALAVSPDGATAWILGVSDGSDRLVRVRLR